MGNTLATDGTTATIASSGTVSTVVSLPAGARAVGVIFGAMTGTAVTVSASATAAGTFAPLSALNTAVSFTVDGTGKYIGFTADVAAAFQAVRYFKFTSGTTEGSARTITVLTVQRES